MVKVCLASWRNSKALSAAGQSKQGREEVMRDKVTMRPSCVEVGELQLSS